MMSGRIKQETEREKIFTLTWQYPRDSLTTYFSHLALCKSTIILITSRHQSIWHSYNRLGESTQCQRENSSQLVTQQEGEKKNYSRIKKKNHHAPQCRATVQCWVLLDLGWTFSLHIRLWHRKCPCVNVQMRFVSTIPRLPSNAAALLINVDGGPCRWLISCLVCLVCLKSASALLLSLSHPTVSNSASFFTPSGDCCQPYHDIVPSKE